MASMRSSDARLPYQPSYRQVAMPEPEIPMRRTPWFMQALWLMAALVLIGIVYSFWRIASVATPKLDVPPTAPTISTNSG
jgi:hypothetical protein